MTDLATKPGSDEASEDGVVEPREAETTPTDGAPVDGGPDEPVYAWAPTEPAPKKRRTALWIGAGAGVAAIALVATSLVLIAPGTTVGGVSVGLMTPGAAAEAIEKQLAETTIVLTGEGNDVEVTGADLGASIDARALADTAFSAQPMWNPTAWFSPVTSTPVHLDDEAATEVLRAAAPELYTDPVDAVLAFDPATASYVATPAVLGTGIDVAAVRDALQSAFVAGDSRVEFDVVPTDIQADTPTYVATATAKRLNAMLDSAGFYIGEERTVPVDRAVAASWLTVSPGARGTFEVTADAAAIQPVVDTLAAAVDRAPENARVITNSAGRVLREEAAGQSGRQLGDSSGIASDYATQLAAGDATFDLPVVEVPVSTVTLARSIEVDLSSQTATLFENGAVVRSYTISSGLSGTPTPTGRFTVNAYVRMQDMGALCYNPAAQNSYCTKNVPWVTYFAPDIAFHGASAFRSRLGVPQSHGCVNMWNDDAKFVYDWTAHGTEVWVHA